MQRKALHPLQHSLAALKVLISHFESLARLPPLPNPLFLFRSRSLHPSFFPTGATSAPTSPLVLFRVLAFSRLAPVAEALENALLQEQVKEGQKTTTLLERALNHRNQQRVSRYVMVLHGSC